MITEINRAEGISRDENPVVDRPHPNLVVSFDRRATVLVQVEFNSVPYIICSPRKSTFLIPSLDARELLSPA